MCVAGDGMFCTHEKIHRLPVCKVIKTDQDAVLPSKLRASDAGYDLTVIKASKQWLHNITLYDTGIRICMDRGYYAEIVPRSSLSKSGYMLANSVGVIDENYRGNIYVALIKVDPDAPLIELPFRCCQILFKRQVHMDIVEVHHEEGFNDTVRQSGGFGSTG
jgi:dUTP pyrophosphatase